MSFRFKDEWLLSALRKADLLDDALVADFRRDRRTYLALALVESGSRSHEDIAGAVRTAFQIATVEPEHAAVDDQCLTLVPERVRRRHEVLPLSADADYVSLAMANPLDMEAIQDVEWVTGRSVVPLYCRPDHLEQLVAHSLSPDAVVYDLLKRLDDTSPVEVLEGGPDAADAPVPGIHAPVIALVNRLIATGVRLRASDIHVEHDDRSSVVRYRVDGVLKQAMILPRYIGAGPVVSRIKIMAGLDVADRLRPQDGRAKLRVGLEEVGLRISTLPTRAGEKVVMRILRDRAARIPLENAGFRPNVLARFRAALDREQGIVLVTGPTGSGKTTTLYASLNSIRGEGTNIMTVEDPIEYRLDGINQVQVNDKQGLDFPTVLRSVLRQDPDVIMVGEIRDQETAHVALQAALTGHLVFSTLHTNDTVASISRLADMGVERFKVGAGLLAVTAQRLVRRLCQECSAPLPDERADPAIRTAQLAMGISAGQSTATGCAACAYSGFLGRVPLMELLEITTEVRALVDSDAGLEQIRDKARAAGALHTMEEDALWHLAQGNTTLEEVRPHLAMDQLEPLQEAPAVATVPAAAPAPTAAPRPTGSVSAAAATEVPADTSIPRILLAASEQIQQIVLKAALTADGFQVELARDGSTALAQLASTAFDGVVVATLTPDLPALAFIQGTRRVLGLVDLPIIAMDEGNDDGASLRQGGASDVAALPMKPGQLQSRLRAVLERRSSWSDSEAIRLPRTPIDEAQRLQALDQTGLLDSPPEERFDSITRTAQHLFQVPLALVSLIGADRQFSKSMQGVLPRETSRTDSFCAHAISGEDVYVVSDTALDATFAENPHVTSGPLVRFYAGCPIKGPGGHALGTICLMDTIPRPFTEDDKASLRALGKLVEAEVQRSGD